MRGTILGVHDGRGVLLSADERRLEFPLTEWRSAGSPSAGLSVDFLEENGEARAVFAAPVSTSTTAPASSSFVLGAIASGCLALGFFIPFLPTLGALVFGLIGASRARAEGDETGLLLSRIGWIGALVLLSLGVLALLVLVILFGGMMSLAAFSFGPDMDF